MLRAERGTEMLDAAIVRGFTSRSDVDQQLHKTILQLVVDEGMELLFLPSILPVGKECQIMIRVRWYDESAKRYIQVQHVPLGIGNAERDIRMLVHQLKVVIARHTGEGN